MKDRAIFTLKNISVLLLACVIYLALYKLIGIGFKCPIYTLTGYLCPCCGSSRMLISVINFDFSSALYYNSATLFIIPLWIIIGISYCYTYIKSGEKKLSKWQKALLWITFAILIVFGILRNVAELGLSPAKYNFGGNLCFKQ